MPRLIDGDALYEKACDLEAQALDYTVKISNDEEKRKWSTILVERTAFKYDVNSAPTIKPERKTGRWIDGQCSNCGCDIPAYIIDWKWQKDMDANYCPNCGAYMGGEQDD